MSKQGNIKKNKQLGMPHGTAIHKLRKKILFHLMKKCEMDTCYQCKKKIESIDELSIEHMTPWLDSNNPVEVFFDIDNIAFSHLSCNCASARQTRVTTCPGLWAYRKGCRCDGCCKLKNEEKRKYLDSKKSKELCYG